MEFGHEQIAKVIRRVGGLEAVARRVFSVVSVIRRVGGLEATAPPKKGKSCYPPCRRLRSLGEAVQKRVERYPPCRRLRSL